jgi:hypothetical protein
MLGCCTCFFQKTTMIGIDLAFAYVQLIIQPQVQRSERRVQPQVRRSKSLTASELAILRK